MTWEWRRLRPDELDHELLWSGVLSGAALLLGMAVWWPLPLEITCPWPALTGIPCPTCGSTRAVLALVAGDWLAALRFHPLLTLAITLATPWLAYGVAASLWRWPRLRLRVDESGARRLRVGAWLAIAATWAFLIVDGR